MARVACAAARDDRDLDGGLDVVDELEVEAAVAAVLVDAVQQDLSGAHGLDGLDELPHVKVAALASALDGALVPAVFLAVGPGRRCLDGVVRCGVRRGDVDAFGVDADDDGLPAVCGGNGLDGRVACEFLAAGVVFLSGGDGVGADADLVGAGLEVHGGDVEGRDLGAVCVDGVADAAADCQGDENRLAGAAQDLEHGRVGDGAVAEGGDVQKRNLVGALLVVLLGHVNGLAQIAHARVAVLFSHIVLVALCDDQIALVVGAHIQTGDDSARQALPGVGGGGQLGQLLRALALQESLEDAQTRGAALLGVELGGHDVVLGHGANELLVAIAGGGDLPAVLLQAARLVGGGVRVDVVVLGRRAQAEQRLVGGLAVVGRVGAVPANVRHALVGVVELAQARGDDAEAAHVGVFLGALEQGLQADAYPHERLARADVGADGLDVAGALELAQAVAEVADAGDDEFLRRRLHQHGSMGEVGSWRGAHTSAAGTSAGDLTHATE